MDIRRMLKCFTIMCLLALSLPHAASADEGVHDSESATECGPGDTATATANHDDSDEGLDPGEDEDESESESEGENEGEDDCVLAPPADVPEAPKALLLSASAAVTGGAALLIIRRRARNSVGSLGA